MKRIINKITVLFTAMIILEQTVSAAVLGTPGGGWQTDMGGGAIYSNNVFVSESVGKQTENYVEYTPNSESVPVVVNGKSIYGKRTISSAVNYMNENNMRPLIGINGDFFSTKTGIPMGYTIIDGKLFSKENGIQDAVGFRSDGTAFIDKIGVSSTLSKNDKKINIQYINKWPQKGFSWVYLLDENYGETTKTEFNALYVICSADDGDLTLDSTMHLNVDEVFIYNGSIKIPAGKYVFVMDPDGDKDCFDLLANLAPGDKLTFANSSYGGVRNSWKGVSYAISTIGGRLVDNGNIGSGFEAGTAPRTAVGIKADGNVIFYTIDGRQSGYSYGIKISTLASRMKELGCVDAINFDGGGSTVIGAVFPGSEKFEVSNKPSDGALRQCANYIFLRDLREKTGIVWYVDWNERENHNYLSGTSFKLEAKSVYDTGNYKMDGLSGISFSIQNSGTSESTVYSDGTIKFSGAGKVKVTANGEKYNKTFSFETFDSPQEIRIINETTGEEISEITVYEDAMTNYSLEAAAYVNGVRLEADPSLFKWSVSGSLVKVDKDGNAAIKDDGTKKGTIIVTTGGITKEIPVNVIKKPTFSDTITHWAHNTIEKMASNNVITGYYENEKLVFKPDDKITRIQFAAIIAKSLGVEISEYENVKLNFTDSGKIQEWAVPYVKAMVGLGYMSGRSDNVSTVYFAPDNSITRAEAVTVISRVLNKKSNGSLNYTDSNKIPQWARDAFVNLSSFGIIQGFEDNTIRPENEITRAEAATLVSKAGF